MSRRRQWKGPSAIVAASLAALAAIPTGARADSTYTQLHAFPVPSSEPRGRLVQTADGTIYGTATHGGPFDQGEIYSLTPDGSGGLVHTTLSGFGWPTPFGWHPYGGLIEGLDGLLYGTTADGPIAARIGCGSVFGATKLGVITALWTFQCGSDGSRPHGTLTQAANGDLYGTTISGGTHGLGVVFKVTPGGSKTVLYSFGGPDGASPYAGLVHASDGNYYGTTVDGGSMGLGTVFRITPSGALTTLHSFQQSEGAHPYAGLIQGADGALYGTTSSSGPSVFRITTGGALSLVHVFSPPDGLTPYGRLVQGADLAFYGTASSGGFGFGTVYRVTSGGAFSAVHYFVGADGSHPDSELIPAVGGGFLGTAPQGGSAGLGTVFRIDSGAATTLYSFGAMDDGSGPSGGLVQGTDGDFYGTTYQGGTSGLGTVFKVTATGTETTLHSFGGDEGANPSTPLVQGSDGDFYGTTDWGGGLYSYGSVFRVTSAGVLTTLHSFRGFAEGSVPGGLIQASDGDFYGTTEYGGANNYGTIFKITTGGALTVLHSFANSDGAYPAGCLIQASDGDIYGLTTGGGVYSLGTVFRLTTAGTLTSLHSFSGPDGAFGGCLVQPSGGDLFGSTTYGGTYRTDTYPGAGTLFRMTTTGSLTSLFSFGAQATGVAPTNLVPDAAGGIIGATGTGGPGCGGTVFRVTPGGAVSTIFTFSSSEGAGPYTPILATDGALYGTAGGGPLGGGVVYRLVPLPAVPGLDWSGPSDITYGTPLSTTQLAASVSIPGTFVYSPAAGTVLAAGPQTLSATFTPDDIVSYSPTTLSVSINVLPVPLAIRADDKTNPYRAPMPALTATYTGFVNGDTPASLVTPAVLSTTANSSSLPGFYPITVSGASSPNYALTMIDGTLTIESSSSAPIPGHFEFSAPGYTASESSAFATITVKRRTGNAAGTMVDYSTADGTATGAAGPNQDYTPTSGTLTFGFNQTSMTFQVPINRDLVHEEKKTVLLRLSNPRPAAQGAGLGSQSTAVLSLRDDDVGGKIRFSPVSYSVDASAGSTVVKLSVRRTGGVASGVTVRYTTADGTARGGVDYQTTAGDLTFLSSGFGALVQTVTVPIIQNTSGAKSFVVTLSSPSGGGVLGPPPTTTAAVTILGEQSTLAFSSANYSAKTTQPSARITVKRTAPLAGTVTVHYATSPGTALNAGVDYTDASGDLTFAPGVSSRTFGVLIAKDILLDTPKTVDLVLSNPTGGGVLDTALGTSVLTILDPNLAPAVQFTNPSFTVSDRAQRLMVGVRRTGDLVGTLTVDYDGVDGTATSGTDYSIAPGTLTFLQNQTIKGIGVTILNDTGVDGTKQFTLQLSHPVWTGGTAALGTRATTTVNMLDSGPRVQFAAAAYSASETAKSLLITVRRLGDRSAPATVAYDATGGTAVRDLGSGGDYALMAGTLSFSAGQSFRTFPIVLEGDRIADGSKTIVLGLSSPLGVGLGTPSVSTVTIRDPYAAGKVQFSAMDFSVAETAGTAVVTLTRTGTSDQATVHYQTLDSDPATSAQAGIDYASTSATITFSAGQKTQSFPIAVFDNGVVDQGAVAISLALDSPGGGLEIGGNSTATVWIVRE